MPEVNPICNSMWSVTPYAHCDIRCHYCCTLAQGPSVPPAEEIDRIVAEILGLPEADTVIFGAFSDAYPNAEAEHGVTRALLVAMAAASRTVVIATKGTLVLRDLDVLRRYGSELLVQMSVSTLDDAASVAMEPGAAPSSERLDALRQLHQAGVPVEVNALPWIPGVSDLNGLLRVLPNDIRVRVSPLATPIGLDRRNLLGRSFTRSEIVNSYLQEYERLGSNPQISWVAPAPTGHHNPIRRLELGAAATVHA